MNSWNGIILRDAIWGCVLLWIFHLIILCLVDRMDFPEICRFQEVPFTCFLFFWNKFGDNMIC